MIFSTIIKDSKLTKKTPFYLQPRITSSFFYQFENPFWYGFETQINSVKILREKDVYREGHNKIKQPNTFWMIGLSFVEC